MAEVSAGGIVVYHNSICLLQKYSGDWVLPKGRREQGESLQETALREVFEEAKVHAEILGYVGAIAYDYCICHMQYKRRKRVYWFLMRAHNNQCQPLRKEGFKKAMFVEMNKAKVILAFESEQQMVKRAVELLQMQGEER